MEEKIYIFKGKNKTKYEINATSALMAMNRLLNELEIEFVKAFSKKEYRNKNRRKKSEVKK